MWRRLRLFFCVVCVALSACAGGGVAHSISSAPATLPVTTASGVGKATVSIKIIVPRHPAANTRLPRYVSTLTQTAAVTVTPAGAAPSPPMTLTCTLTCSGQVTASVGNNTVTVNLYDASSNLLSAGAVTINVLPNHANVLNLTFNPVVSSVSAALAATFNPGTPTAAPATITLKDADGNTIVGPVCPSTRT